jgi:hypothetical protein
VVLLIFVRWVRVRRIGTSELALCLSFGSRRFFLSTGGASATRLIIPVENLRPKHPTRGRVTQPYPSGPAAFSERLRSGLIEYRI